MLASRASSTALCVAALRALESESDAPLVLDEPAARLLPPAWSKAFAYAGRSRFTSAALRALPDVLSPGRLQHIALRTRVIDDLVTRELALGATQLVLLGAGFDTRAYRLAAAARATVFEVDHPATQADKRARGAALVPRSRAQHFIATDFEREGFAAPLVAAGFSPAARSVFLWEGVTMYLPLAAIARTLAEARGLCGPETALLVTYHDASGASGPASRSTALMARLLGEPFRSDSSPGEMRALLGEHGFAVEGDTGRDDWARASGRIPRGRAHERLAVARLAWQPETARPKRLLG
jgi:methyltransferase (TIGR00027 family)